MTAGAITVLTFRKLKHIAIKSHWGQKKHAASRDFLATARLLFIYVRCTKLLFKAG